MNHQPIIIPRNAPWLPPSLLKTGEQSYKIKFSSAERKIFRRGKKLRPSRWCAAYRYVTMSRMAGKWKNEVTPYLAGIMDASFFHSVREITICATPQTGKTEATANCIAVAIDQEPGPVIVIYPDEKTSNDNSQDRFQQMIKSSPKLRAYMTGMADDMSNNRIGLIHMPIYFGWARSAASMANKPCRYAINDEVDKYTDGKKETSAILQTKNRLLTYEGIEKHWIISSPTVETGPIWKCYNAAQVRFDYYVKCPKCGESQLMKFGHIKWQHDDQPGADGKCHSLDPEKIESEKLAWYECPHCMAKWDDYARDQAVEKGHWQDTVTGIELLKYLNTYLPAKIAFRIPAWISRFVPFAKTAACFLRGQTDFDELKNFSNKHAAEPWKLVTIKKDEAGILAARIDLPPQTVPESAIALTCGIDVQKHGFWFVVRAWTPTLTSWLVHYGYLETWDEVEKLLFETSYPVAETGRTMRIFRACIDTGGGEKHEDMTMTDEAYYWLIRNRGRGGVSVWGTKGASNPLPDKLKIGGEILATASGKKLPAAVRIISVDTNKMKDQFHYALQIAAAADTKHLPGAAHLHAGAGPDYAAQILAEEKQITEKGGEIWINPHRRPNHLLDAEILAAVCVDMQFPGGGLRLIGGKKQETPQPRRVISAGVQETGWFKR